MADTVTRIVKARDPSFKADPDMLGAIIKKAYPGTDVTDPKYRLVRRAANVFAGILVNEPFSSSKSLAAIIVMRDYLLDNDYLLPVSKLDELADVLSETDKNNLTVVVQKFLSKNIAPFT